MNGWAQNWYMYQPFGQTSQSKPSFDNWNRFRFTGREADETGLYYYRARYYAPDLGRFISEDPAGLDDFGNQYAYAGNDPVNLVDPLGLNIMRPQAAHGFRRILPPYHGDPDFIDDQLPGGFPVTLNGVRRVVVGDFQFLGQVASYAKRQVQSLLSVFLPPNLLRGGNIRIEIPKSQEQDIIDEFLQGRPTRPLTDQKTGAIKGEMTTDAGPTRRVIYQHTDPGTPEPHINLHDDATGTNIRVVLK